MPSFGVAVRSASLIADTARHAIFVIWFRKCMQKMSDAQHDKQYIFLKCWKITQKCRGFHTVCHLAYLYLPFSKLPPVLFSSYYESFVIERWWGELFEIGGLNGYVP